MLTMTEYIDVIVPRGGPSLIERVQQESRIPVFAHRDGICHVYLHAAADPEMARQVVLNAKMRRTSVCGAAETLLVDREAATRLLPGVLADLIEAGCEVRGDAEVQAIDRAGAAGERGRLVDRIPGCDPCRQSGGRAGRGDRRTSTATARTTPTAS